MGITPQNGVDLGSAYAEVVVDFSKAEQMANTAFANMEKNLGQKINALGQGMQTVGKNITLMTAPLSAFVAQGILAFANFDEVMTEIQARTGATADEMERVKDVALEMGKTTAFSAADASQAMLELLSSGSSLEETLIALPHVLNLAASSGIGLGESADALTDILAQFQLGVTKLRPRLQEIADLYGLNDEKLGEWLDSLTGSDTTLGQFAEAVDLSAADLVRYFENFENLDPLTKSKFQEAASALGLSIGDIKTQLDALTAADTPFAKFATDIDLSMPEFIEWYSSLEDAETVVQSLSAATQSSSAKMPELIDAFARVGPVAKTFGLTVDETAATLAVLAENGIKGAASGDALKSMFLQMSRATDESDGAWKALNTSMYDAYGNMRPLDDIIDDINKGLADKSPEKRNQIIQDLAGAHGRLALESLLASDGIDTMQGKMDDAADASELASSKMNSWKGIVNQVKSSIETLSITVIGPLVEEYLAPLGKQLVDIINVMNDWMVANPELAEQIGVLLGVLVLVGPAIFGIGTALTIIASPMGLVAIGIVALVAALGGLWIAYEQNFMGFGDGVDEVVAKVVPALESIVDWFGKIVDAVKDGDWDKVGELINAGIEGALDALKEGSIDAAAWLKSAILDPVADYLKNVDWGQVLSDAGNLIMNILTVIGGAEITIATWVYDNIIKPLYEALVNWVENDAEEDLKAFGDGALSALKKAVSFGEDGLDWVREQLIDPIIAKLKDYAENDLEDDMNAFGEATRKFLIEAVKFSSEAMDWVKENLIVPIRDRLEAWLENDAVDDLTAFGEGAIQAIKDVLDFTDSAADFVRDKIITPFVEGFLGLDFTALEDAAGTVGTAIMDAIGATVTGSIANVEAIVKHAFNAIVPDNFTLSIDRQEIAGVEVFPGVSKSINIPQPFPGYAEGGMYPGGQPRMVGEKGMEMDVPRSSGLIVNNDQLKTALNVLTNGGMASPMSAAGAGAVAGGGDVNISGGVQISIDGSAVPAGASPADVADAVWHKFTEAARRAGGGTVGANGR